MFVNNNGEFLVKRKFCISQNLMNWTKSDCRDSKLKSVLQCIINYI